MTPADAILILVWLLIILAIAWVAEYAATRMFAPDPLPPVARIVIWGVAVLVVLFVLLDALDGVDLGMPRLDAD